MPDIEFHKGNLFEFDEPCVIAHVCNDIGLFGAGFALAVSRQCPIVRQAYIERYQQQGFRLGDVQFVQAGERTFANMIAQQGVRSARNPHPIKYNSLEFCLMEVYQFAKDQNTPVVMPKIGSGFAGGNWTVIEGIIRSTATITTHIYEL